jgi:hypothetical protein
MMLYNGAMPPRKLNLERFSVSVSPEVKMALEKLAAENGRSLSVEAGRLLENYLRQASLLPGSSSQGSGQQKS